VDFLDRRKVQAEHRVGRDQHIDVAGQLARQHGALHVAARQARIGAPSPWVLMP
jgi:hypothetical protein